MSTPDNPPTPARSKFRFTRESRAAAGFLLRYFKPYWLKFLISLLALLASSLAGLAFPWLTGAMVQAVTQGTSDLGGIDRVVVIVFVVLVAQSAFSYVRTYFIMEVSERSLADLRRDLYERMLRLPMSFFHQNRVGELSSRLNNDVGTIHTTMTTTLSELIRQTVILIGGIALVAYTSLKLSAVILTAIPILVLLAVLFGRSIRRASKQVQDLYAELNTVVEETFQGIGIVKAFTAERYESERYRGKLRTVIGVSLKVARSRGAFIAFIIFVLFGGIAGVIWFGGRMVQTGELTFGELTTFVLYAFFVAGAMGSFADLYSSLQRTLGASERVRDLMTMTAEQLELSVERTRLRGAVELRDVRFAYASRPDIEVLKGISFQVPAGTSLALVGPSGSGKSTLAGLLMRFYEPTAGTVIVDGRDATEYGLADFRSAVAIVPQEVQLFGGTIAENIAYGRPGAEESEIREAARLANAIEFVESFPEGFATIVGERGVQLSGGQRQRIAIARAIIKDPSILILDEATSSLDSQSERLVQDALDHVLQGRTTFIIAHRLSTIRNADRIAVIHHGEISEMGTYDELIARGGIFARLVALQNQVGDEIDPGVLLE